MKFHIAINALLLGVLAGCQNASEDTARTPAPTPSSEQQNEVPVANLPQPGSSAPAPSSSVPSPSPLIPGPNALRLDEAKLREVVLDNNLDIFFGANNVRIAKGRVNLARTELLPKVNLGGLATSIADPSFLISQVTILLPFLIPNNWFELFKQNELLHADQAAFRIIQLNIYAESYSLLLQVQSDLKIRDFLVEQLDYSSKVAEYTGLNYRAGLASKDDWDLARGEEENARARLLQVEGMLVNEFATLTNALNLPPRTEIAPDAAGPAPTIFERIPFDDAVTEANDRSIELMQIADLRKAAVQERWQKVFGFISGASLSQQVSASDMAGGRSVRVDFGKMTGSGLFTFGLDQFASYELSNRAIADIDLRIKQARRETGRVIEDSLGRLAKANARLDAATRAEGYQRSVLESALVRYHLGGIELLDLVQQQARLREASIIRLQAASTVEQLRVILQRTALEGQFDEIQDCRHLDLRARALFGRKANMPKEACGLEKHADAAEAN